MKLVVGLGNPGERYRQSRHNIGFMVVDQLANLHQAGWTSAFDGLTAEIWVGGGKAVLLKPMTYMNRSGLSVRKAVDFFKLHVDDLLIVCDDINLPVGRIRIRAKGSSGGQNGLKDIFSHLGAQEVSRLRIGVGSPVRVDAAEYVLSGFPAAEAETVQDAVIDAARAVELWCREGVEAAMNQFNGKELKE
jgi:PTH1 family peptidyl-tRNA hydrolase